MQLRKHKKEGAEVAAESLNDIMFFLLLFFLIVSTLVNPNVIRLALPGQKKAEQKVNKPKNPVVISVTKTKDYYIGDTRVPKEQLESYLTNAFAGQTEPVCALRIDRDLVIQDFVDILQVGEKLNIKMVLASAPNK